ncbi:MAG: restriction endonuclease subunit S [Verrucomicrobiota bacterium]|jgi:type I restriction enzyme S subunit
MATWPKVKLAECVNLLAGFPFKSQQFTDKPEDVPLVKGENVSQGCILWEISKRWPASDWEKMEKFHLVPGDVVIAMDRPWIPAGLKWSYIRAGDPKSLLVQRCARLRSSNGRLDQNFLRFVIGGPGFESYVKPITSGVNVPHISGQQILDFEFPLPPLPIQRRIASILSAYDDLIENSQRRIRILETMARALYREWFVHFRFPGHEKHPRVASPLGDIPQGWEVKTVADSIEISGGGTPSRKEDKYWDGGTIQWFSPSDLTGAGTMFMDDSSDHITELGLAESSARLFPARSVMLTSRATIGAIAINTHEACTNQGFITCLPNERVPLYFLFHWVTENVPTFQRMASGATFKEISRGVFKTIEFIQPPAKLVRRFEESVAPMAEQVLTLQREIQNLRRTRDLLLPRLLSGQVELETN